MRLNKSLLPLFSNSYALIKRQCRNKILKNPLINVVGTRPLNKLVSKLGNRKTKANAVVWGSSLIELKIPNGNIALDSLTSIAHGHDLLVLGPQNKFKTIAPLLPFAIITNSVKYKFNFKKLYVIVLVPTRDLVIQESRNIKAYIKHLRVSTIYHKDLEWYKTNILVSTPAGLLNKVKNESYSLKSVILLCIHESQEVLSMNFKCGSLNICKIKSLLHPNHQTIYTSRFADHSLKLFIQSISKLNFRILNFWEGNVINPVKPVWGPYRSAVQPIPTNSLINSHLIPTNDPTDNSLQKLLNYYKWLSNQRFIKNLSAKTIHIKSKLYYILYQPIKFFETLLFACEGNRVICFFPTVNFLQFMNLLLKKRFKNVFMLCGSQSLDKRRLVVDNFKNKDRGLLLTTDIACLGLDLGEFDKVVQVGPSRSYYNFASRSNMAKASISLFHDLDCHYLFLLYRNLGVNVEPMKILNEKIVIEKIELDDYMLASLTLAYRSVISMYCSMAKDFKFEKWQVPSLFNDIFKSIGIDVDIGITKQFAARMGIMNSPGLYVDYSSPGKTTLLATVLGYPGYISRLSQLKQSSDRDGEILKEFKPLRL